MAGGSALDEGPIMGAALALMLYGLTVVFVSAAFGTELVPASGWLGVLMIALLVAGSAVGAAVDTQKARR